MSKNKSNKWFPSKGTLKGTKKIESSSEDFKEDSNKSSKKNSTGKTGKSKKTKKEKIVLLLLFLASFLFLTSAFYGVFSEKPHLSSDEFFTNLESGKYSEVVASNNVTSLGIVLETTDKKTKEKTEIIIFNTEKNINKLEKGSDKSKTEFTIENSSSSFNVITSLLSLSFSGIMVFYILRMLRGNTGIGVSSSDLKKTSSENRLVTFADVAGKQEEKKELMDIVKYFNDKENYEKRGLTIPRGILLEGPSGTGKTLLAKALAGETKASFFSLTGSEFNGMYRGTGTTKIKTLFKEARENAPSVIFIDEIDALARKRGGQTLNTADRDSDQTLNQLLTEMDGFSALNTDVVVLGATNLADSLDPAVLRSGRFDRKIYVGLPNKTERSQILSYYLRNKKINEDVDVIGLGNQIQGFSGADIEGLVNEANLISYNRGNEDITKEDFEEAFNKMVAGLEKKSTVYTEEQKEIIANHESGHAVVGALVSGAKKVSKVTIVPHGRAGGFALFIPKDEMFVQTKEYLENTIVTLLAGRGAEEILSNTQTTGVSMDIKEATEIARGMVLNYGMSNSLQYSEGELIDNEGLSKKVDAILNEKYEIAKNLILENEPRVRLLSQVLKYKETIYEKEINHIVSLDNEEIREDFDNIYNTIISKEF